jgi:DNA polymerase epsilon subunit 2
VVSLLVEAEETVNVASPAATSAQSAVCGAQHWWLTLFHYYPIQKYFYEYVYALFPFISRELGTGLEN